MATAFLSDSRFAAHTMPGHPEHAGRLVAIQQRLEDDHLAERLVRLEFDSAPEDCLRAAHSSGYLAELAATAGRPMTLFGLDTYVTPHSYETARLAVGGALRGVEAVMRGEVDNAIVAIRPPGHHATPTHGMGFCLLNNVAIAARYAQSVCGVERVLIVDYDVHHGNGTQDIFYADPTVMYVSTHESPLYPGTGAAHETGEGAAAGYTLNIPLPAGVGDEGFRRVFQELVIPAAQHFEPDLVLVSTGFDAHWGDPLAHLRLSLAGYDWLARTLLETAQDLCRGRILFVMEGGYNLPVLAHGWANVARALLGEDEIADPLGAAPGKEPSIEVLLARLKQLHKLV